MRVDTEQIITDNKFKNSVSQKLETFVEKYGVSGAFPGKRFMGYSFFY